MKPTLSSTIGILVLAMVGFVFCAQSPVMPSQSHEESSTQAKTIYIHGAPIKVLERKNAAVFMLGQAIPFRLGWSKYIAVAFTIQNRSALTLDFDPSAIQADDVLKGEPLRKVSVEEIIKKVGRRYGLLVWGQALQAFGRATTGNFSAYDSNGTMYNGTYSTYRPADPYIQQQRIEAIREQQTMAIANIRILSLARETMAPGSYVFGLMYFARPRKNVKLDIKVPIADEIFRFSIP